MILVEQIMSFFAPTLLVQDGVVLFAGGEESGLVKSTGGATKSDTLTALDAGSGAEAWKACEKLLQERGCADTSMPGGPLHEVAFHAIEVSFDRIENAQDRQYFQGLPTALALPDEAVERLMRVGRELLAGSSDFQELVDALDGETTP